MWVEQDVFGGGAEDVTSAWFGVICLEMSPR